MAPPFKRTTCMAHTREDSPWTVPVMMPALRRYWVRAVDGLPSLKEEIEAPHCSNSEILLAFLSAKTLLPQDNAGKTVVPLEWL